MYSRHTVSPALRRLATLQEGVVTREQAIGHQLSPKVIDRLVRESHWRRLWPGVFLTAAAEPSWMSLAWAGVLIGGDQAGLGGSAAAHVHGLVTSPPATITVLIPHAVRRQDLEPWAFRRQRAESSLRFRGSPPRSRVEDTALDLCATSRPEDVIGWLTAAIQQRLTTPAKLEAALAGRPRQRHRSLIVSLLSDVATGAQSPIELAYLNDVERAHGLPAGRRQKRSRDGRSIRDVEYEEYGVVVELDGRLGHQGMGRFRDMWRDNVAALDALITLRYGGYDVLSRPCEVAMQVGTALTSRGWADVPIRCSRCRQVA